MRVLFNDHEPYVAAWLRNLYPGADVTERGIEELSGDDLVGYERVHLFAGIGGWEYALELAGWTGTVWTGSCPCQPFSAAGKRKAQADARDLWPEFRRLIAECRPPVVFGEQVASDLGRQWLARVRADLEALGYRVGAADLCAASAGAPHIRQRLFWVADTDAGRREGQDVSVRQPRQDEAAPEQRGRDRGVADTEGPEHLQPRPEQDGKQARSSNGGEAGGLGDAASRRNVRPDEPTGLLREPEQSSPWSDFDLIECADGKTRRIEPGTFPLASGVPARVGRLRAYGNSIVPQVAAAFVRAYMTVLAERKEVP